jgi:hypothetical protein
MEHAASLESPVEPIAVRHARDLDSPARDWLQRLFGRPLRDDEDVTIVLSAPHKAAPASERRAAFQQMEKILDRAEKNMRDLPNDEFDEAADEAMKHVRPTFEP